MRYKVVIMCLVSYCLLVINSHIFVEQKVKEENYQQALVGATVLTTMFPTDYTQMKKARLLVENTKDYEKIEKALEKVKGSNYQADVFELYGQIYYKQGEYNKAIQNYEKSIMMSEEGTLKKLNALLNVILNGKTQRILKTNEALNNSFSKHDYYLASEDEKKKLLELIQKIYNEEFKTMKCSEETLNCTIYEFLKKEIMIMGEIK